MAASDADAPRSLAEVLAFVAGAELADARRSDRAGPAWMSC